MSESGDLERKSEDDLAKTRMSPPPPAPATDSSVRDTRPPPPSDPGPTRIFGGPGAGPPRRFGRYEIFSEIARGGMGVVYRARQTEMNRTVALKVLLSGGFASEDDERRFAHEAELAARLSHPNIVAVHDFGREGGRLFFTMEFVEGEPLDRWAKDRSLPERLRAVAKACRAVHHAHMRGVIHRDLKPGNILVTAAGEPKVLDFGLAKGTSAGAATMSTASGATIGTPFYMAPEQADGRVKDIDIRTDVYAMGVVLHQLVSGEVPFRGATMIEVAQRILNDEPPRLEAPADLAVVIRKAMEKEKALRYATAEALAEDIERFLAGEPVSARAPGIGRMAKRWVRRHPAAAAGMLAVTVTLAAVAGWWATRDGEMVFEVDAPGAWVEIDGVRQPTGSVVRVRPGEHEIVARAEGREPESRGVYVGRGERRTQNFRLPIATGRLTLETDEPGTFLTVLGENHGTPLTNMPIPVGRHTAIVRRPGEWSRVLDVDIRRNEETRLWTSVPESSSWAVKFPDGGATESRLRDVNGDGVLDVSGWQYTFMLTFDGRNGTRLLQTRFAEGTVQPRLLWTDVDGDGIEDDVVAFTLDTPAGHMVRVRAMSGNLAAAEPQRDTQAATQHELWSRDLPHPGESPLPPVMMEVGDNLWIVDAQGIEGLRKKDGASVQCILFANAALLGSAPGGDVLAVSETEAARISPGGQILWEAPLDHGSGVVVSPGYPPNPAFAGPIGFISPKGLFARSMEDGRELWRVEAGGAKVAFQVPAGPACTRLLAMRTAKGVRCLDAETGREVSSLAFESPETEIPLTVAGPGILVTALDRAIVCRDCASGKERWRKDLGATIQGLPCCHESGGHPRIAVATSDLRFRIFDTDGVECSEFSLRNLCGRIQPCDADGYGETDFILTGYGYSLVRGTRILWRRMFANAVRPRPVAIPVDGHVRIALAIRGNDDVRSLHCLDGRTGDILWKAGKGFDCIFEPLLVDVDKDGVLDIGLTCRGESDRQEFRVHSGRDGRVLLSATSGEQVAYGRASFLGEDPAGRPGFLIFPMDTGIAVTRPGAPEFDWTVKADMMMTGSALADLDGDGREDILVAVGNGGRTNGKLFAIRADGKTLWTVDTGESVRSIPGLLDLDGDGRPEILVGGDKDLHIFDRGGHPIGLREGLGGSHYPPVPCDVGGRHALLAGTRSGVVCTLTDGTVLWRYPSAAVLGAVAIAQLPGGHRRVAGADREGRFFVLDLETGREFFHLSGTEMCEGGVTLADVDGDGIPEAFFGENDGWLTAVDIR